MNGHAFENGVIFLQFEAVRRVLAVLLGHIARRTRNAGIFMLGAFEDDLNAVSFALLGHFLSRLKS